LSDLGASAKRPDQGSGYDDTGSFVAVRTGIGILIEDATNRRLVEAAAIQLDLIPMFLEEGALRVETLAALELILADEQAALKIQGILATRSEWDRGVNPTLIAVQPKDAEAGVSAGDSMHARLARQGLNVVLVLPQEPASVVTKLSLILYAHRGLAKRYQSALEELYLNKKIFQSVTTGITVADATDPGLPLIYVNPAFEVMTGYRFEEVRGNNCRFLQGPDRDQPGLTVLREALKESREVVVILKNYKKDGTGFWNELTLSPIFSRDGLLTHFVGIQMDVTVREDAVAALRESQRQLVRANEQLTLLSVTDPLTGLKNRREFEARLAAEFSGIKRNRRAASLVMLDIDYFKRINDEYGHPAGDEVLIEVAGVLERSLRAIDLAARYGGEEFAILLPDTVAASALLWADRLYGMLEEVVWRHGAVTVSVGIAEINAELGSVVEAMRRADQALYQAKDEGRARAVVYEDPE
jgi:diguanylate cyclase (GGDEF)-like protein/PAS domain S-box-containing protein